MEGRVRLRAQGAAGGSYERPMERGVNCVERNGSERSQVASVANRKPPASPCADWPPEPGYSSGGESRSYSSPLRREPTSAGSDGRMASSHPPPNGSAVG